MVAKALKRSKLCQNKQNRNFNQLRREKYDQKFFEAMKLKLKLNTEGGLQALRKSIAEQTVKRHPKANIEEIMKAMEEMAF